MIGRKETPTGSGRSDSWVIIIDDDLSMREALCSLFDSVGLRSKAFASADELLKHDLAAISGCLVVDIRMPGVSGFDLLTELARSRVSLPIVFMTGYGDIPMTVKAMKAGAIDFLAKPFRDQDMLDAVTMALERDRERRYTETAASALKTLFESLTPREQQIMAMVADGLMNKHIAAEIGLSEITVKVHRGRVMKKMGARSLADLVRMADALGVRRSPTAP